VRAAVIQTTTGIDPAGNITQLTDTLARAAAQGADIAFTPEMSGLLDRQRERLFANVREESDDPVLAAVREAAARHGLWVQLGSLALRPDAGAGRLVNRGFLIDGDGAIRARYDKMHLFDVDLPSGETYRESSAYTAGPGAVVAQTPWGRLGLSICYDVRFAALYAALAQAGAVLLSVPAAFTVPTGKAHWHVLLRARAIESGAFVVAAAQVGLHADGRSTYGHSLVVDPWGEVLMDLGGEGSGVGVVDIDMARVAEVRGRVPALSHRRAIAPAEVAA
jgi:predicted amidohydrolase